MKIKMESPKQPTILNNKAATSKECRINFNKIVAFMDMLEELGTRVEDTKNAKT